MFFYMYENMAEFCLLGCDECRATEPGRNRKQAADTRAAGREWRTQGKHGKAASPTGTRRQGSTGWVLTSRKQASRHTVRQWGMEAKVDPLHPRNRHKGG